MNRTGIEWCDWTWNPIVGCSPVSEGCKNCYAKTMAHRLAHNPKLPERTRDAYGRALSPDGKTWASPPCLTLLPERLDEPARVKKPARIFVCSMSDLGHDLLPCEWRAAVIGAMVQAPWHTYIILSKRPGPWMRGLPAACWVGVTAENQSRANERIPLLLRYAKHAAVRFVSVEPMLGPVDLRAWLSCSGCGTRIAKHLPAGAIACCPESTPMLDWVIAGPETGPGARECRAEWIGALADQCERAGVPFFDKRKTWLRREWPEYLRAGRVARPGERDK